MTSSSTFHPISYETRDPDYRVSATIRLDEEALENVSCAIYLPKKVVEESPYVILTTTESQANILASHWKFELVADVLGVDSEVVATIHAPEMYAENSRTRHWGGNCWLPFKTDPGFPSNSDPGYGCPVYLGVCG